MIINNSIVNKLAIKFIFLLITAILFFDAIYNIREQGVNRLLPVILQSFVLFICLIYFVKYLLILIVKGKAPSFFHFFLIFFILLISTYALFSSNLEKLPVLLLGITPFFIFYESSLRDNISKKLISNFTIVTLIIFTYQTYDGVIYRINNFSDFLNIADNTGYLLVSWILFRMLLKKNFINFILITFAYLLILISLKRGAIIIATIIYIVNTAPYLFGNINLSFKEKFFIRLFTSIVLIFLVYQLIVFSEFLFNRFLTINEDGGSSRFEFYSLILNSWYNSDTLNWMFGHGFFSVSELLLGTNVTGLQTTYAHSDIQILYDHGFFGLIIYLILFFTYILNYKFIKNKLSLNYYHIFLLVAMTWVFKSTYSGIYMLKESLLLFALMGFVLGKSKNYN